MQISRQSDKLSPQSSNKCWTKWPTDDWRILREIADKVSTYDRLRWKKFALNYDIVDRFWVECKSRWRRGRCMSFPTSERVSDYFFFHRKLCFWFIGKWELLAENSCQFLEWTLIYSNLVRSRNLETKKDESTSGKLFYSAKKMFSFFHTSIRISSICVNTLIHL